MFYVSNWLVDVILVVASEIFVFSGRKAISGDILCALYSAAENSAFLLSGGDASLVCGKLVIWLSISSHPGWHLLWVVSPLHLSH